MKKFLFVFVLVSFCCVAVALSSLVPFKVDFSNDARIAFSGLDENSYRLACYQQSCANGTVGCDVGDDAHVGDVFVTYQRYLPDKTGQQAEVLGRAQGQFVGSAPAWFTVPAAADEVQVVVTAKLPTSGFCRLMS